jgi:hypothetical protein
MKKVLLFLIVFFITLNVHAQSWSELGTGSNALNGNSTINRMVTDASGNVYAGALVST